MSTEEKPLPDFSGDTPAGLPVRPVTARGIPRGPAKAPVSAFSIIESDETSRTLDFGMSEEDMLDDSDGEGSSSELHDSLRALHSTPGAIEEDFTGLRDYETGVSEEDTYRTPVSNFPVSDFELPDLDTAPAPIAVSRPIPTAASKPAAISTPAPTSRREARKALELPDFSKFDEVEEVEETAKPTRSTPLEEVAEPKKKLPLKLLLIIAAVIIAVVVVVIFLTLPGSGSPAVIAPSVDQFVHLLR